MVVGGEKHPLGGNFFSPTILSEVNEGMSVCREEIFGPVAPVMKFERLVLVLVLIWW